MRLSESLGELSERMGAGRAEVVGVVFGRWEEVVGPAVAAHVRPQRLQEDTLVVVADHPAWATQMRHLAPDILDRLDQACGVSHGPRRLEVRVRA